MIFILQDERGKRDTEVGHLAPNKKMHTHAGSHTPEPPTCHPPQLGNEAAPAREVPPTAPQQQQAGDAKRWKFRIQKARTSNPSISVDSGSESSSASARSDKGADGGGSVATFKELNSHMKKVPRAGNENPLPATFF